jgi:site-specific DNA recombinase
VFRTPEILAATSAKAKAQSQDNSIGDTDVRQALHQFDRLWDELFPAEQTRIVQLLVERVDVSTGGAAIRLRTEGLRTLVEELNAPRLEQAA